MIIMGNSYLSIFIYIAIFIDILIALYFLINCKNNPKLNNNKRNKWIALILIFNILGAAAYSYYTRKKFASYSKIDQIRVDKNIKDTIFLCLVFLFQLLSAASLYQSGNNRLYLIMLIISLMLYCLRYFKFPSCTSYFCYILAAIQIIIISYADFTLAIFDNKFIILVVLAGIIIDYPLKFIKYFSPVPLIIFIFFSVLKLSMFNVDVSTSSIIIYAIRNSITYTVFFSVIYIFKKQILMNYTLENLMHELRDKTIELEEMSIVRERNRIAREVHDTLGHSLTGVLVNLEAAKRLASIDSDKTAELIEKSQAITREGFNDIKRALKALKPLSIEENTLENAITNIIERFEEKKDLSINTVIDIPNIDDLELKTNLYRIIQEIITNCSRHSEASILNINIESNNNTLRINTDDNGKGCSQIREGNGLKGIRERIELLGGDIYFNSSENEGFNTTIYIPMKNHLRG